MKEGVPAWSVVVVLFDSADNVLAISRGFNTRDLAMPGGDSIEEDDAPATTATRELFEETGVRALELRCFDQWEGERGQPVYAFHVPRWRGGRLRTSDEGKPFWANIKKLLHKQATFREHAERLLLRLEKVQAA